MTVPIVSLTEELARFEAAVEAAAWAIVAKGTLGVAASGLLVSTVPDELLKGVTNVNLVRQVRALAPEATMIACAKVADPAQTPACPGESTPMVWKKSGRKE